MMSEFDSGHRSHALDVEPVALIGRRLGSLVQSHVQQVVEATLAQSKPAGSPLDLGYIDPVLAQLALPRKATDARVFERRSGEAILRLEAGQLLRNGRFEAQPLPSGSLARFVLLALGREAALTKNPEINLGRSAAAFLRRWGCDGGGDGHAELMRQVKAIAAVGILVGRRTKSGDRTLVGRIVDATTLDLERGWPRSVHLTAEFFDAVTTRGAPILLPAVRGLRRSALAMDIFTWASLRLPLATPQWTFIAWESLFEQFAEGPAPKFRRDFSAAAQLVTRVWPGFGRAFSLIPTGVLLRHTNSPVPRLPRRRARHSEVTP